MNEMKKTDGMKSKDGQRKTGISVQAENGNFSDPTFQNGFDPRIDLAPFFWPPDMVFTYHPGPLVPSSWPPGLDPTILTILGR